MIKTYKIYLLIISFLLIYASPAFALEGSPESISLQCPAMKLESTSSGDLYHDRKTGDIYYMAADGSIMGKKIGADRFAFVLTLGGAEYLIYQNEAGGLELNDMQSLRKPITLSNSACQQAVMRTTVNPTVPAGTIDKNTIQMEKVR